MSDNPSAAYLFFIAKKRQPEPELFRPFGVAVSAESVGDADILLGLASPTGLRGRASTNVAGSGASPSSDEKRKRPAKWDDAAEAVYFSGFSSHVTVIRSL